MMDEKKRYRIGNGTGKTRPVKGFTSFMKGRRQKEIEKKKTNLKTKR